MAIDPTLQRLIQALTCQAGIGKKSAQRIAIQLLERNRSAAKTLAEALNEAVDTIHHCQQCRNYTTQTLCAICENDQRDASVVCVVENLADMMAIEQASVFMGRYFVLMGRLSPIDGIGPAEIGLDLLIDQVKTQGVKEVIIATSSTAEGEATAYFLSASLQNEPVEITRIANGVPMGGELEYIDKDTLSYALSRRERIDAD